jgi:hypothetical protein
MITNINEFKKYIINETVLNYEEELIDDYLSNIDDYELYVYQYKDETYYIDNDLDDDEIEDSEDFKNWLNYEIIYKLDNLFEEFKRLFSDGTCTLYRKISVSNDWFNNIQEYQTMGIYWTDNESLAESYWSDGNKNEVLLATTVKSEQVNWKKTYIERIKIFTGDAESEIQLKKDTIIYLDNIEINDKIQNIDHLKKLQFKA